MNTSVFSPEDIHRAFAETIKDVPQERVDLLCEDLKTSGRWNVSRETLRCSVAQAVSGNHEDRHLALINMQSAAKRISTLMNEDVRDNATDGGLSRKARDSTCTQAQEVSCITKAFQALEAAELDKLIVLSGLGETPSAYTGRPKLPAESSRTASHRWVRPGDTGRLPQGDIIDNSSSAEGRSIAVAASSNDVTDTVTRLSGLLALRSHASKQIKARKRKNKGSKADAIALAALKSTLRTCQQGVDEVLTDMILGRLETRAGPAESGGLSEDEAVPGLDFDTLTIGTDSDDEGR